MGRRLIAMGIDPGKQGAAVVTESSTVLEKFCTPTRPGKRGRVYQHDLIKEWLDGVVERYRDDQIVCGLEISWPIPTKDVLPETRYYQFAEDVQKVFHQSPDFAENAQQEYETHAVIELARRLVKDFSGGKESNITSFQQGGGSMLWVVHLSYHPQIRWAAYAPAKWHSVICVGVSGATAKDRAWEACKRLYPDQDFRSSNRARKQHSGLVDAADLAEMARRDFWPEYANPQQKGPF